VTDERLAEIRKELSAWMPADRVGGVLTLVQERDLLARLAAVTKERDDARGLLESEKRWYADQRDITLGTINDLEAAEADAGALAQALERIANRKAADRWWPEHVARAALAARSKS
jgi:hypothetical protein